MIGIINFPFSWDQRSQGICPAFKPSISFSTGNSVMYIVAMANWTTGLPIQFGTAALSRRHLYSLLVEECFRLTLILDCVYMSNGCCINSKFGIFCGAYIPSFFLILHECVPFLFINAFPLCECFVASPLVHSFLPREWVPSSFMNVFLLCECI